MGLSATLLTTGLVCIIAAIIGGGLKAFGIEISILQSTNRQILLAIFGFLLIIGSYYAHEQSNLAAHRMELIEQWRNGIESTKDSEWNDMSFQDKLWYSSLRQYMKQDLERPRTLIVPSEGRGGNPTKQILSDEVARIEKEWGLTGLPLK